MPHCVGDCPLQVEHLLRALRDTWLTMEVTFSELGPLEVPYSPASFLSSARSCSVLVSHVGTLPLVCGLGHWAGSRHCFVLTFQPGAFPVAGSSVSGVLRCL